MRLPDFIRTTTFRWTLGSFVVGIFLFAGFIYWQTAAFLTTNYDYVISEDARVIAAAAPDQRLIAIENRLKQDPRRIRFAGFFDPDGRWLAGNVKSMPTGLSRDGLIQTVVVVRSIESGTENQTIRATARVLPSGEILIIGRSIPELEDIAEIVQRALVLGLPLALCFGIATAWLVSVRGQKRVVEVNELVQRIVAGDLRQRLPLDGLEHPFDKLATVINGMLDEIEALIHKISGIGDDIAHELRTPLTRVRLSLERGRSNAKNLEELQAVSDRAIAGLDQSLAIVTALLRIAEIEHHRRLAGFGEVSLADLVRQVGDLYEPIAEDKRITFGVEIKEEPTVRGDRDLLLEAVANLVDNAIKYTPEGGTVYLSLVRRGNESAIQVRDTGPGIREDEREAVTQRFYRSDRSRRSAGIGLGLSLVAAIVKLHGFRLTIAGGPGCTVEIVCPQPH